MRPRPADAIAWSRPALCQRARSAGRARPSTPWQGERSLSPRPQLATTTAPVPPALAIVRLAFDIDRLLIFAAGRIARGDIGWRWCVIGLWRGRRTVGDNRRRTIIGRRRRWAIAIGLRRRRDVRLRRRGTISLRRWTVSL